MSQTDCAVSIAASKFRSVVMMGLTFVQFWRRRSRVEVRGMTAEKEQPVLVMSSSREVGRDILKHTLVMVPDGCRKEVFPPQLSLEFRISNTLL